VLNPVESPTQKKSVSWQHRLYTGWCYLCLVSIFALLFPAMFIFLQKRSWHPQAHRLNRLWGKVFLWLIGIRLEVDCCFQPEPGQTYIFAPNHTSYLDTALMGVVLNHYFAFVGKSDLQRIPLFGYMFIRLHLAVDRSNARSRYQVWQQATDLLASGRSVVIFPEGGIRTENPPFLHENLKDGAFRLAIEKQIPLVPVTFLYNHLILPDDGRFIFHRHPAKATVHLPISPENLCLDNLENFKQSYRQAVEGELKKGDPQNRR
jgi:1-acyl-sn-glycerol-3-phosphate acyltransferase